MPERQTANPMSDPRAALLEAVDAVRQKYCDYRILADFPALLDAALKQAREEREMAWAEAFTHLLIRYKAQCCEQGATDADLCEDATVQWAEAILRGAPDADPNEECSRFPAMDWDGEKYFSSPCQWMDEPDDAAVYRVGKKLAGRLLDGREHTELPAHPAS